MNLSLCAALLLTSVAGAHAQSISGLWDATVKFNDYTIPFPVEFSQNGPDLAASFFNGDDRVISTSGRLAGNSITVDFGYYATQLNAVLVNGELKGTYGGKRNGFHDFEAKPHRDITPANIAAPDISGAWDLPNETPQVKNPKEPFRFRFPDLNGIMVSNTDPRFKNKVVIVAVTGSWRPNCHDEAPFLMELYRKYHARGLEIVALDFEEPEQLKDFGRLRAFIKKYGIEYTCLIAGQPEELEAKIPQAQNLNSWPTTFFLGRDGKVRAIHAGFAATATGSFNVALKRDVTERVEQLLSEDAEASR